MKKRTILSYTSLSILPLALSAGNANEKKEAKPNVVIIYMDDLGYGDISCYGAKSIKTPNIDALVNEGIRFTDGHATSATSTPSRYGLLTGMYPWRNKEAQILPGSAPLIIDTAQETLPKMFQRSGYYTGIVGKWHLGLGNGNLDWNKEITPGPNQLGFDYSYIMAATKDRVPTVYIQNGKVVNLSSNDPLYVNYEKNFEGEPTALTHPEMVKMMWSHGHNNSIVNGIPRIGFQKGGKSAYWNDENMAKQFLGKAEDFIIAHKSHPFFLYYAMDQPHVPRTPSSRFVGKSGMGPRGDVILEADWCIGQFMKTLKNEGLLDNTLIVFSSDNGPVLDDGYQDEAVELVGKHKPGGPLRGGKYSLFEAGTRIPFAIIWQGIIKPQVSDALVCQMDLLSSFAALLGTKEEKGLDSQNTLNTFLGKSKEGRKSLILEATTRTAYREGDWLLIPPYKGPAVNKEVNIELGNSKTYLLYNLKADVGQQNNVANKNPEKLKEMIAHFVKQRGVDYKNIQKMVLK